VNFRPPTPQSGIVLLLCLVFLTMLTLLGLSASADAVLQNQLAANLQETERAKQAALAALSWAEDWLLALEGAAPEPCLTPCAGLYVHATGTLRPHPEREGLPWWQAQGYEAGIDPLTGNRLVTFASGSANPPMWLVEVIHAIPASADGRTKAQAWYRILARGSGQTDTAIAVAESIITRPWPAAEGLWDEDMSAAEKGRVAWRQLR